MNAGNLTTTENIVRQMTKREIKEQIKERDPILTSNLKKGMKVQVFDDPTSPHALLHGVATLKKLNDAQVYHTKRGYENWRVEFEDGETADRIISVRHLVPDGKSTLQNWREGITPKP